MSVDLKTLYQKRTNGVEGVRWNLTSPLFKKKNNNIQPSLSIHFLSGPSTLTFLLMNFLYLDIRETVSFYETNNVGFI